MDGDFTGSMAITVFDAEQKAETLESNIPAYLEKKQEYSDFPGLIYAGNARVENGYFGPIEKKRIKSAAVYRILPLKNRGKIETLIK